MNIREKFSEGKVLLVDKEYEWTSFDVVNKIRLILRNQLGIKKIKVGHAGTLDPLATGLMIVCTGKATKTIDKYQSLDKEYIFRMKLGETTPSFDLETEVSFVKDPDYVTLDMISIIKKNFTGEIMQTPPVYSAKYISGTRAYEYAREGKKIEMIPVPVTVKELEIIEFNKPFLNCRIICSKGTYIRSLVKDIGDELGCGAYLQSLRRMAIGEYNVRQALIISDIEQKINDI